jgi:hypothetical protein
LNQPFEKSNMGLSRHCERSEAIQTSRVRLSGLLRRLRLLAMTAQNKKAPPERGFSKTDQAA